MRKLLKRVVCFVMAVVLGASSSIPAFADNPCSRYPKNSNEYQQCWIEFAGQNNILFYDPAGGGTDCAPSTINGDSVTIIGDSISYGARSEYASQIPSADYEEKTFNGVTYQLTQVSKHFSADVDGNYSGMTIARVLQEQGVLRPYVVFALGTNDPGVVTEGKIKELMDLIGTNHRVVLVTNYAIDGHLDYSVNNAAIRAAKNKYDNVAVADWAAEMESKSNPAEYIPDTEYWVHPNENGNKLFVELIKKALNSLAGGIGGVSSNNNRNYAGAQVWSQEELDNIAANKTIYEEAAKEYGFPWQVLATVHSLETNLKRNNPSNGQGVYQLYVYTDGGRNENSFYPAGKISEEEFRRQTMIAAEIISGMAGDLNDPDNVKKLFLSYNGTGAPYYPEKARALGFDEAGVARGEGSPYVMNRYDERRDPTSLKMDDVWRGRFVDDGIYDPESVSTGFGAFVKYEALGGGGFCSSGYGKIADTAINLAWSVEEWATRSGGDGKCIQSGGTLFPHPWCEPKPEYEEAMKSLGAFSDTGNVSPGASCDKFVSTVMKFSGADSDFIEYYVPSQMTYMEGKPSMYTKVNVKTIDDLQPGDIFATGGHIVLYVGLIDGKETVAEASRGGYTARLSNTSTYISRLKDRGEISDNYGDGGSLRVYEVFRRINWNGS
ncbi:MAG: hypothetical protein Q4F61_01985 [Candidatus Saccharibacteria bacterium]|nr:hypothetical protein [Candidatus Saccharibacteria bacterium]